MPDMKAGWNLYRAVWLPASGVSALLVVLPYALLMLWGLRTVAYSLNDFMLMTSGIGYQTDLGYAMYGQLRAFSSMSSIMSYLVRLVLMPIACAALAVLYSARWNGAQPPLRQIFIDIKPTLFRTILTGVFVMFMVNLLRWVVNIAVSLLSMVASLFSIIPLLGTLLYGLVIIISLLIEGAVALVSLCALVFALHMSQSGALTPMQAAMAALRMIWAERARLIPGLVCTLCAAALGLAACAVAAVLLGGLFGGAAALNFALVLVSLAAAVFIPAMCAYFTTLYKGSSPATNSYFDMFNRFRNGF